VKQRRYLVVESDKLSRDETCAVFRWLKEACDWGLAAVVDTGGKSLHGWFRSPDEDLEEAKIVLGELGCDTKMFTPSQPVRIPGIMREDGGGMQKLIYFDPAEVNV